MDSSFGDNQSSQKQPAGHELTTRPEGSLYLTCDLYEKAHKLEKQIIQIVKDFRGGCCIN